MNEDFPQSHDFYARVQKACSHLFHRDIDSALPIINALQVEYKNAAEVFYLLGLTASVLDEFGRAAALFEEAHNVDPDCLEYCEALANLNTRIGNVTEGLYYAKLGITLSPHPHVKQLLPEDFTDYFASLEHIELPRHHINGTIQLAHNQFKDAKREFGRYLKLNADHTLSLVGMSAACLALGNVTESINYAQRATVVSPDDAAAHLQAGIVCQVIGKTEAALFHFDRVIEAQPDTLDYISAAWRRARNLRHLSAFNPAKMKAELDRRVAQAPGLPEEAQRPAERSGKIKIGYVTNALNNFDDHLWIEPLIRHHNRIDFDIFVYHQSQGTGALLSKVVGMASGDRKLWQLDDETAAIIIAGDEIDILIDTTSPDKDCRASLMALRSAPLQVTIDPNGSGAGLPWIDFVISDPTVSDLIEIEALPSQKTITASSGLWSTSKLSFLPNVSPLPLAQNEALTIGAICELASLDPVTLDWFAKVLEEVPDAKLLFGATGNLDEYASAQIKSLFKIKGYQGRVSVYQSTQVDEELMVDPQYWAQIDVMLALGDIQAPGRFAEALWMGVPVMTVPGYRPLGRTAKSMLIDAGCETWVFDTISEISNELCELTSNAEALSITRQELRQRVSESILFDPVKRVRAIETIFLDLVAQQ